MEPNPNEKPPVPEPLDPPSPLPPAAQQLAALLVQGKALPDAIVFLGLDPVAASGWLQDPSFASLLSSLAPPDEYIRQMFLVEAGRSVETIKDLRDGAIDPKVRLASARDLLDRAGYTPVRKVATVSYRLPGERKTLINATVEELMED